jgi:hypothetical protein
MSPSIPQLSLGLKYTFPLTPRYEDTKRYRSRYCYTSCPISLTQIHPETPHTSTYIILFYIKQKQKHTCKDVLFVRIHNSLIYLHLVLSTPRDVGKQDSRHNNLTKSMNIMMCLQSITSYEVPTQR